VKHLVEAEPTEPFKIKGKAKLVRGYRILAVEPYPSRTIGM
jgi:hypothetical protein